MQKLLIVVLFELLELRWLWENFLVEIQQRKNSYKLWIRGKILLCKVNFRMNGELDGDWLEEEEAKSEKEAEGVARSKGEARSEGEARPNEGGCGGVWNGCKVDIIISVTGTIELNDVGKEL